VEYKVVFNVVRTGSFPLITECFKNNNLAVKDTDETRDGGNLILLAGDGSTENISSRWPSRFLKSAASK